MRAIPGKSLFEPEGSASPELNLTIFAMLQRLDELAHIEPRIFWVIGLRFFEGYWSVGLQGRT